MYKINSLCSGPVLTARNCNNPAQTELSRFRLESSLVHEKGVWQFALTGHVASCFIANAFAIEYVTKEDILYRSPSNNAHPPNSILLEGRVARTPPRQATWSSN